MRLEKIKGLSRVTSVELKKLFPKKKNTGDLGLVAQASRSSQSMMRKPDPLTVAKVFNTFRLISKVHFSSTSLVYDIVILSFLSLSLSQYYFFMNLSGIAQLWLC